MKQKLLHCAALALVAGSLSPPVWTQATTEEARHWLERMLQATQTLNYEGTFVYVQGPHLEAMRIVHGSGPEGERQRLFSLNGPPREIVVANNSVICLLPKQRATFAGGDYQHSPFPLSIPRELGRLENHYALEVLGEDRVAGLDVRVIAIKPRDAWRFGYRFWLDQRNGMVLRSALLDDKGYPVEQLVFTDLQVKPQIDEAALKPQTSAPSTTLPETVEKASDGQTPTGEPVTQSVWNVGELPEGFVKVMHNRFTETSGQHPIEHMVFADGLATISVFLEKLDGASPLLQGGSQFGSMNAYGRVVDNHQILVVGEVPAATVQRIAVSIQYRPAKASDD